MTGLSAQEQHLAKAYKPAEVHVEPKLPPMPPGAQTLAGFSGGFAFGIAQEHPFRMVEAARGRSLSSAHAPIRAVLRLQSFWGLSDETLLAICGLPMEPDQSPAQSLAKYSKLPDVKTRLRSLMSIRMRLSALLGGDAVGERRWLNTPWDRIDKKTPLSLMMSTNISDLLRVEAAMREIAGA